jgi:hypothetical protein
MARISPLSIIIAVRYRDIVGNFGKLRVFHQGYVFGLLIYAPCAACPSKLSSPELYLSIVCQAMQRMRFQ